MSTENQKSWCSPEHFFLFGGMGKSAAGRLPSLLLYPLLHLEAAATLALRPPGLQFPDGNDTVVSFGHTVAQDLGAEEGASAPGRTWSLYLGIPDPLVCSRASSRFPALLPITPRTQQTLLGLRYSKGYCTSLLKSLRSLALFCKTNKQTKNLS